MFILEPTKKTDLLNVKGEKNINELLNAEKIVYF